MPRGRGRPVRASRPVNTANQPNNVQTRGRKRQAEEDGDSLAEDTSLQSNADVWVLGDSLPYWAGVHASDTFKSNLKIDGVSIAWWGKRGLGWSGLRRHIELQVLFSQPPKMFLYYRYFHGTDTLTRRSFCTISQCKAIYTMYLSTEKPYFAIREKTKLQGSSMFRL
ncbi:uncharacterized protein LOC132728663 isoform X2 [Ruditapes philippinarum]|uniref:uncharacterized protein LOC132728663 isoform X2 n=1 Tax=Ruditapes philippinarum TaxID=129788 RepID=UPI00295B0C11|nr:uncharacterized protein LOC132728663 isoform X2 [Ruditapes philippinarum]